MAAANHIPKKTKRPNLLARVLLTLSLFVLGLAITAVSADSCPCGPDKRLVGYTYDKDGNPIPICEPTFSCPATNNPDESTACSLGSDWQGEHPYWFDADGGSLGLGPFGDEGDGSTNRGNVFCPGIYYTGTATEDSDVHDYEETITVNKNFSEGVEICVEYSELNPDLCIKKNTSAR